VELYKDAQPTLKKCNSNRALTLECKFLSRQYSVKDEQVITIFHLLNKGNKLKLPEVRQPDEVGRTNNLNYYLFHRMVHHPTSKYFVLNDKIQALIDTRVLTLKSEQKRVTANMVSLNFTKVIVQNGLTPIPEARLDVINPMAEKQETKGLVLLTIKCGEIMWVYPDIVKDE